jgi:hypothetical protein
MQVTSCNRRLSDVLKMAVDDVKALVSTGAVLNMDTWFNEEAVSGPGCQACLAGAYILGRMKEVGDGPGYFYRTQERIDEDRLISLALDEVRRGRIAEALIFFDNFDETDDSAWSYRGALRELQDQSSFATSLSTSLSTYMNDQYSWTQLFSAYTGVVYESDMDIFIENMEARVEFIKAIENLVLDGEKIEVTSVSQPS